MDRREHVLEMIRLQDANDSEAYALRYAEDGVFVHPAATLRGREEIAAFMTGYHVAFPDGRHTVTKILQDGDVVAVEGTFTGTNTGPLPGPDGELPPTGRTATIGWAGIATVGPDGLRSMHGYYDQLALLGQLGLAPAPASA